MTGIGAHALSGYCRIFIPLLQVQLGLLKGVQIVTLSVEA